MKTSIYPFDLGHSSAPNGRALGAKHHSKGKRHAVLSQSAQVATSLHLLAV